MESGNLWDVELIAVSRLLESGEVSSRELTELMLARIAEFDGRLHSYVTVAAESARLAADAADAEIRAGRRRGPLHGVPIAVKDLLFTRDIKTGLGSPIYDEWQAPYESTVTARLADAGAVMLGKLTLTEGVYADHHPTITPPINPFGAAHWTGTSSSGSGVAVTSGLCYGALGSDTGGSIRLPSSCCGVVGIKPTWGRVSRHGALSLAESMDHIGPMARSAADAAALLGVIAGPDPADPTAAPLPVPDYLAEIGAGLAGASLAVDWAFLKSKATDEVLATIAAVAATLVRLGARLVDVTFPESEPILLGWAVQCSVEAALAHAQTYPSRKSEYGPRFAALLERGHATTGLDMATALKDRREFNGEMAHLFANIDLLLVPGLPVAGPSLGYMASLGPDPAGILAIGPFTAPFDVCGYPTITFPCGVSADGIPIGCQLVAKPFAESLLCRAARAYQGATDWHRRRPDLTSPP
jgi:amidase